MVLLKILYMSLTWVVPPYLYLLFLGLVFYSIPEFLHVHVLGFWE